MLTPPRGKVNGRIFQHNQIANCGEEEIRTMTDEGAENIVNGGESAPEPLHPLLVFKFDAKS